MKITSINSSRLSKKATLFLCLFSGILAGFLCGFLGTGGGILLLFTLKILFPHFDTKDLFANTILSILPMTLLSSIISYTTHTFSLSKALLYCIPALGGGVIGAFLLEKIKTEWLKFLFAILLLYSGITMIIDG